MTSRGSRVLVLLCAIGYLIAHVQATYFFNIFDENAVSASKARDLRAQTKFHYMKANDAQNKMFEAENKDDVEEYEKWLQVMREEDAKMHKYGEQYDELRDYLEAQIRMGEIVIQGFTMRYDKSALSSAIDRLTFRATD